MSADAPIGNPELPAMSPAAVGVRRALISVWDKSGLREFAAGLSALGVELIATGGTARALAAAAIPVTRIEALTGAPETLDGRVKTLHPSVFAAILARDLPAHRRQLDALGVRPIDLVAVNLYPFEEQAADRTPQDAVELIDIGGVALLRAAAKNWERVAAVCDPGQYPEVLTELAQTGALGPATRRRLAAAAFARTAAYDAAIAASFAGEDPLAAGRLTLSYQKVMDVRYGENPHQRAALYRDPRGRPGTLAAARRLQGKELSYNNLLDLDAAWGLVWDLAPPAAAIIKHAAPCGAAVAASAAGAYAAARDGDPVSAFGGVVGFNVPVDEDAAAALAGIFTEAVIAPGFTAGARATLARRPHLRVVEADPPADRGGLEVRTISGGLLVQTPDAATLEKAAVRVVTPRAPTDAEMADLRFAWTVAKWVKSNAIVLAKGGATVGIGGGQPNRVGAVEIAARVAGDRSRGAVLASDGFFPFRDGIDAAARAGVTAVIQPGGSLRDEEVIAAAAEHGLAMVFTGIRHFRH